MEHAQGGSLENIELDFKVDTKKITDKKALGINIMYHEGCITYLYGTAGGVISKFMIDFFYYPDVETLVLDEETVVEVMGILEDCRENIAEQLNSTIRERGYDAQGEVIVEKALINMQERIKRHGMYVIFETVIV